VVKKRYCDSNQLTDVTLHTIYYIVPVMELVIEKYTGFGYWVRNLVFILLALCYLTTSYVNINWHSNTYHQGAEKNVEHPKGSQNDGSSGIRPMSKRYLPQTKRILQSNALVVVGYIVPDVKIPSTRYFQCPSALYFHLQETSNIPDRSPPLCKG
jgi:hypothetical protein